MQTRRCIGRGTRRDREATIQAQLTANYHGSGHLKAIFDVIDLTDDTKASALPLQNLPLLQVEARLSIARP